MRSGEADGVREVARNETPIGKMIAGDILAGTLINIVMNLFFCWLTFPRDQPIELMGMHGLLFDTLPATIIPAFMMTLVVTMIVRKRLRAGLIPSGGLPFTLPRSLVARAVAVVVIALLLVGVPTALLLVTIWSEPWTWPELIVFKIVFSAFHAIVLTPVVVFAEMQSGATR